MLPGKFNPRRRGTVTDAYRSERDLPKRVFCTVFSIIFIIIVNDVILLFIITAQDDSVNSRTWPTNVIIKRVKKNDWSP